MGLLPVVVVVVVVLIFAVALSMAFSAKKGEQRVGAKKRLQGKDRSQVLKEANRRLASNPKDLEALSALGRDSLGRAGLGTGLQGL